MCQFRSCETVPLPVGIVTGQILFYAHDADRHSAICNRYGLLLCTSPAIVPDQRQSSGILVCAEHLTAKHLKIARNSAARRGNRSPLKQSVLQYLE